jgi:iron transport multicopper oxidase
MDGVPGITQCDIKLGQSFIYEFIASPAGTRFYHSHSGDQTEKGCAGAFIINSPTDPYKSQVSNDQIVLLSDMYPDVLGVGFILIGEGRTFINGIRGENYTISNGLLPFPIFNVTSGSCTRLRFIFGGGETHVFSVVFTHPVDIIAVDGNDIAKVSGQTGFFLTPGERIDCLVCGTRTSGNYPFRVDAQGSPASNHPPSWGFVHYVDHPILPTMEGVGTGGGANVAWPAMKANWLYADGEHTFQMAAWGAGGSGSHRGFPPQGVADQVVTLTAAFSRVGFAAPGVPFKGFTLNADNWPATLPDTPYLHNKGLDERCTPPHANYHYIWNSSVVDVIVNHQLAVPHNESGIAHPIHLHGFDFWVLGHGPFIDSTVDPADGNRVEYLDPDLTSRRARCGHDLDELSNCKYIDSIDRAKLNFVNPPLKDTVILPPGTWLYYRFVADNPGVWFSHCHIGSHMLEGMHTTFNVMPYSQPDLPDNTVSCGNCRPDYNKVFGTYSSCSSCCTSGTCPSTTCNTCSSSGSGASNTNTVSNTVNVNFANMFNGLNLT